MKLLLYWSVYWTVSVCLCSPFPFRPTATYDVNAALFLVATINKKNMLKYIIMFVPSCKVLNELSKNVPVALVQTSLKPEQADLSSSISFEFVMELT